MKHRFSLSAAGIMFGMIASGATAADLTTEPPIADDWSGFYVGLHAGWGWADIDFSLEPDDDFHETGDFEGFSTDGDGPVFGAQLGINSQMDTFLVGVEVDISWSGIDGDFEGDEVPGPTYFFNADSNVDWLASIRARAGIVFDQFLLYGTGGIAFAYLDTDATSDWSGTTFSDSDSHWHAGLVIGGGAEMLVTDNMTARVEYLHYEFDDEDFTFHLGSGYTARPEADLDVDVIRVGLNFLL